MVHSCINPITTLHYFRRPWHNLHIYAAEFLCPLIKWTQREGATCEAFSNDLSRKATKYGQAEKLHFGNAIKSDHYWRGVAGKVHGSSPGSLPCDEVKIQFWLLWLVIKDSLPTYGDLKARVEREETTFCFELAVLSVNRVRCVTTEQKGVQKDMLCLFVCLFIYNYES